MVDDSKYSTVCSFKYDLEELIEGAELAIVPFQIL